MRLATPLVLLTVLLGLTSSVSAQEKGQAGITMGYPASIGLVYHVSDKIAVRPDVAFSHSSGETATPVGAITSDSSSFSVGVSALLYLREWDKLRTYVSPRYGFSRTSADTDSIVIGGSSVHTSTTTHAFGGLFGAQYSLHRRFSVFGEVGINVSHGTGTSDSTSTTSTSNSISSRTGAGLIFYF
jgi:Outer membrane protein beta-barrel domain